MLACPTFRLSLVLPFLGILCLVAACGDDTSDGGSKSGARTASDLHGTWTFDVDRMREAASAAGVGAGATDGALELMADLTVTFSDGWTVDNEGRRSEWKVTSMDGDTWTISHKKDSDDKWWDPSTLVWIDDDHVGVKEKDKHGNDGEMLYLKRQK